VSFYCLPFGFLFLLSSTAGLKRYSNRLVLGPASFHFPGNILTLCFARAGLFAFNQWHIDNLQGIIGNLSVLIVNLINAVLPLEGDY